MNAMQIGFLVMAVMAVTTLAVPFDFFQVSGFDESNNRQNFEDVPSSVDQPGREVAVAEQAREFQIEFEPNPQEEVRRGAAIEEELSRDDSAANSAHEEGNSSAASSSSSSSAVMSINQRRVAVDSIQGNQ
ncbi:uncharacterized protein LOC109408096 [Aedes albopictus]|uniref:Secreted protein n=1 Tax=Aedes albopictus TaxID=7160 RepID=A0ABM1XP24_AEDAL